VCHADGGLVTVVMYDEMTGVRKVSRSVVGGKIRAYAIRVSVTDGGMDWMRDSRMEWVNGIEYVSARWELFWMPE
jgi:hypothetical protein